MVKDNKPEFQPSNRNLQITVTNCRISGKCDPVRQCYKSMSAFISATKSRILPVLGIICFLMAGCETSTHAPLSAGIDATPDPNVVLREGDSVKITFAGAAQLDSAQQIRRDGKIALPTFGEMQASGLTPAQLEKQIIERFGKDLVTKEVTVTLVSAQYPVFVNGAVLRPGKIEATRPITALEAIMEAGGFDYAKANVKSVKVIRTEGSEVKTFILDFKPVLEGKPSVPFYVRPSDIIFVPERFTLF
jgi:polysaccharide export outer membrane protein